MYSAALIDELIVKRQHETIIDLKDSFDNYFNLSDEQVLPRSF